MKIELYKGDCLEILKKIKSKSIDLILTDPPYELENHGGGKTDLAQRELVKNKHIDFTSGGYDMDLVFSEFLRICKTPNILIFCSNKQISRIMNFFESKKLSTTLLIWNKTNPSPLCNGKHLSDIEFIIYVRGKNATFNNNTPFEYKRKVFTSPITPNKFRYHPTQKPIELIKQYIELHSNENDIILDPFMGSGTIAIPCMQLNRNFIGIEIDEKYFNISDKRINENILNDIEVIKYE